jgi:hypothetical protein
MQSAAGTQHDVLADDAERSYLATGPDLSPGMNNGGRMNLKLSHAV